MRSKRQHGQAVILFLLSLSLFLLGGIGLAIDASQLYAHRQMAQAAADAAAQAAVMSIFDKTNEGSNAFGSTPFTCVTGTDERTPCVYARYNGFGQTNSDVVSVAFPQPLPGVDLSDEDNPPAVRVTITRTVDTTLMRFVGPSTAAIAAQATAAILKVVSPVPIIVLHPTMSSSFQKNGSNSIVICGGPRKSIQVNSSSSASIEVNGASGTVDLRKAGPKNWSGPNSCAGEGADFGDFGGPNTYPGTLLTGNDGEYVQPASPIKDPLISVLPPALPGGVGGSAPIPGGTGACPPAQATCRLYSPGRYPVGIKIKNQFALFQPGVYYIQGGGFKIESNGVAWMASGNTDPAGCSNPTTDTGCGMLVYNNGSNPNDTFEITSNAGKIGGVSYGNKLLGASDAGPYMGILFFQNRNSPYLQHQFQGGGGLELRGTIYLTSTELTMRASPNTYQFLQLQGNAGSTTRIIGMVIVDRLLMGGTSDILMTLDPAAKLRIRQVALVR